MGTDDFSISKGRHTGAEQFDKNDLLLFLDVDMAFSGQFLQRVRANTVQGKQVYDMIEMDD